MINLLGARFLEPAASPFEIVGPLVETAAEQAKVILVDIHAEVTSEKVAMGRHLAGRVTAVLGTHTHVQTNDAALLRGGTAYLTDAGMTGPHDSVIGVKTEIVLRRFLTQLPQKFETAEGDVRLEGALIECDPATGRATAIETFRRKLRRAAARRRARSRRARGCARARGRRHRRRSRRHHAGRGRGTPRREEGRPGIQSAASAERTAVGHEHREQQRPDARAGRKPMARA